MEMQLKIVSKSEVHKIIDEIPGDTVFVLSYDKTIGFSDTGKHIKKKKCNKIVDKSDEITLSENEITKMLNIYNEQKKFDFFNRGNIVKSILIPKLE